MALGGGWVAGEFVVEIVPVEARLLAAASQRTTLELVSQEICGLLEASWAFFRAHPGLRHSGQNVAVYTQQPGGVSVEVGIKVLESFEPAGDVVLSHIPGGVAATTAYYGPYDRLGEARTAVRRWCREHQVGFAA